MSSCPTQILSLRRKRTCLHNHRSIYIYIHIYICIRVSRFQTSRETPVPEHPHCVTTFRIVFTHTVVVSFSHDYNYCPPFDHLYPLVEKKQWQREREREKGVKKLFPLERTTFTRIVHRDPDDRVASRLPRNEFFPKTMQRKARRLHAVFKRSVLALGQRGKMVCGMERMEGGREGEQVLLADRATNRRGPRSLTQILQTAKHSRLSSSLLVRCLYILPSFQKSSLSKGWNISR